MDYIGYYDAVEILSNYIDKMNELLELLKSLKENNFENSHELQIIKEELRQYKSEVSISLKLFTLYDSNEYSQNFLLPAVSIAHGFLREVSVSKVNPNSYNNINSKLQKVKYYFQKYHNNLITIKHP
ncbi:hypothetical protein BC6307_17980 [Sutcliffiella cohnii]|uniref:Uncharacterized protein n=1 Tax=Sutcliffiella cohnii TaxID=33932 RepID=A0A223KU44_9BACI|nr:hypothetical protein [Sutcliffiella cohnii]AST93012.1 hypothetical protein BC6307_17980 [Sutcliffiella cohnii]